MLGLGDGTSTRTVHTVDNFCAVACQSTDGAYYAWLVADNAGDSTDRVAGIDIDDLPEVMHELFLQAVADARAVVEPSADFDAFVEELWQQTSAAFGLTRREWLRGAPEPWPAVVDAQRGLAEAVLEGRLPPDDLPA